MAWKHIPLQKRMACTSQLLAGPPFLSTVAAEGWTSYISVSLTPDVMLDFPNPNADATGSPEGWLMLALQTICNDFPRWSAIQTLVTLSEFE